MPFAIRTLVLPSELRRELKSPLGKLIIGSPEETMKGLEKLVSKEKPAMIISVGDVISENMAKHGILTHLAIVDNRVMRQPRKPVVLKVNQTIHVKNLPGTITDEAWLAVKKALKQKRPVKIVVDGEEDLLTLVALLHAPLNALVVYGQPYEGIVAVKVTQRKRQKARRITKVKDALSNQQPFGSMPMEVKIIDKKYNPLLKRNEVVFEVKHEKVKGTPPRLEIRAKLAEMLKMKLDQVYMRKVETKTGTMLALGEANAYDTVEQAVLIEPKYVIERNTPKEKAKEAEKPKKPEKAAEPKEPEKPAEEAEKAEETKQPKEKGE